LPVTCPILYRLQGCGIDGNHYFCPVIDLFIIKLQSKMMDLFKKLQGLFGGDNSAEAIEKQMQKMQEQMQAAFGGEETKRGWQPDEGVYYAKGEYDNAVEYNNELICLSNYGLDQMAKMNDAMDAKDYNRAEWVRLEWIEDLKGLREQAAALGAYDGDDRMLKALYKVFDGWEALMKDGYKTLIKMRLDGLRGTPEEQAQLKKNNTILVRLIDNLNDASEEFLDAHGVGDYDYDDDDED